MKKNIIIPILCACLLGYICASFIFNQYGITSFAFNEEGNIYFLQCGAYNTEEASKQKIEGIENKITMKEDDKYYSYIGMTSSIKVAEEIQKIYKKKGADIYIKTKYIEEENLINQIKQYDVLLESSKTIEEINSVLKTVLATYDEIMTNS